MAGWVSKKLMDVCVLQRGFDLPKVQRKSGDTPLISSSGYIDFHSIAKVKGPGVVTGRSGSIGQVFYIKEDFWPLNTTLYIKDFHGNDPRFVYYLLQNFDLNKYTSGAGVPTLNRNHVHDEMVLVASCVEEQKRIVAILDEVFADIEQVRTKTEQNLKNARELFESYLQQVFSQRGDGWVTSKLKDITSKIGSGATPRGGRAAYKEEGISLIRSLNIHDRTFREKNLAFIDDEQAGKLSNVVVESGDVLLNITGASVARCAVVPDSFLPARVNQHVSIIRPNQSVLNSEFLSFILTSKHYKDQLLGIGEAGATRQAITKSQIETFEVDYPNSLEEQTRLLSKLHELEEQTKNVQANYNKKLEFLDELKKSILQKAFSGELTQKNNQGAVA